MTNNKPILSIVTPNLNGGDYLEETILSVINQDYEGVLFDFEITCNCKPSKPTLKILFSLI